MIPEDVRKRTPKTEGYPVEGRRGGRGWLAAAARAATVRRGEDGADPDLGALLGQARLHRGVTRALEPDHHVVGVLRALRLTPPVGQQVLLAGGGGLAQLGPSPGTRTYRRSWRISL